MFGNIKCNEFIDEYWDFLDFFFFFKFVLGLFFFPLFILFLKSHSALNRYVTACSSISFNMYIHIDMNDMTLITVSNDKLIVAYIL